MPELFGLLAGARGIERGVLLREGFQSTATSAAGDNSAGAMAVGASLGSIAPLPGHCLWVESISLHSAIDILVFVQRADANMIANGAASSLNPVAVGPTYGSPVISVNDLVREGESISFILRSAVSSGAGTNTLQFRGGFLGRRVTNDLAFEATKVAMIIGDSIVNTTGPTYGSEFFHALLGRDLRKAGKHHRRILKGDGGWKTAHAVIAMQRGWFDVPQADLICMMLGTNETLLSDFQANLPLLVSWMQDMYPRSLKCIIGPPPRQDSVETNLLQPLRIWTDTYVAGLGDPKFHFTSLGESFDRTNSALYAASDGAAGTRVHPIAAGHLAMKSTLVSDWQAGGFWDQL